jgi:hypothetical protein
MRRARQFFGSTCLIPFSGWWTSLSLKKAWQADYAKTIMGGGFIIGLISMQGPFASQA